MVKTNTFQDLIVWQKAHLFVLSIYKVTKTFPKEETYELTSQFIRAATSIAANIAEGYKKKGIKDKLRFFYIAQGSLKECRYYIILCNDLNYINNSDELNKTIIEVSKLLNGYCKTILNSLKA